MRKFYKADLDELAAIAADVEVFCAQTGADSASAFALNLCLDEIFTNIVEYGYKRDASNKVEIEYLPVAEGGKTVGVQVHVRDSAPAFDPFSDAPAPDVVSKLEDRDIGGLGIFLVKKNMDRVEYSRKGNINELSMFRKFK